MKINKIILSSTVAALILTTTSFADSAKIDTVDVWETEVVSSSLSLGNEIETRQADHLSDLFRDLPGVDVGGSHSMNNKIYLRGIPDQDIDIRIDGAKQPNADMFHHMSTLNINPDILKKVNIEVGANSIVHGELGGSIEFETKDGKDLLEKGKRFGGIISTNYNSNKSIGGSLALYGKATDNSDFFAYYSYINNKDWKTGNGTTEKGRDGEIDDIILKYGIDISDNQRISFSFDKMKNEGDYLPRPNFSTIANIAIADARGYSDYIQPTEYLRDTYTIKHSFDNGENLLLNTSLYMNEMDLTRDEDGDNGRGNTLNGVVKNRGITSRAQSNIESGNILNTFTYGLEYDNQTSKVTADGSKYGDDEESKTLALYVEDTIDFGNRLIVTPGIRFTNYKLDGISGDYNENEVTYSLAAEYGLTNNLSLLANYTTLFKGVPMQEVFATYRVNGNVIESKNLDSETGDNKEIGFKYLQENVLGADNIGFLVKYYVTDMDNDIGYSGTWGTDYQLSNLGETRTQGIEASFAYNLNDFSSIITYSKMDSEIKYTGESLDEQAGDKVSLNLNYKINNQFETSWKSIFVKGETDLDPANAIDRKAGYGVHDISFTYKPESVKGLKVITGIDNIFDKQYAAHSSHYQYIAAFGDITDFEPGRSLKVTVSYKF
jgi:hemoglobin/transferrin/lactoferrin receptor protein